MVAHRAAYKLTLDRARENSDIASARGVMVFEVMDACDGWATRQRFTLVLTDRDGQEIDTGSDYSTFETKDGRRIRFSLTQTTQGAVTSRISGEAEITPEGGRVRYIDPEGKEEALPRGTILPMMHTIQALDAARRGQRLLVAPLFDGTSAEGAQDSTTVISAWQAAQPGVRFPALAALGSARMRVAFFDRNDQSGGGASAPEYEVGMRYWENGVADELKMDFGDFVIDGRMEELAVTPGAC
ncbi:MAG: cell envelope integrity EipB family protein [Acetobacteraceae bacterium]|nr:cell envelope integrity EipB family protein [Acetobacteraceae bacterium]